MSDRLTPKRLKQRADEITQVFFLRWNKDNAWQFKVGDQNGEHGHCDSDTKTILINHDYDDIDLEPLLVHGISHVLSGPGHKKQWQTRMLRAAEKAVSVRREGLAGLLRKEVDGYRKSIALGLGSERDTYGYVENCLMDDPSLSYESVVNDLARQLTMSPRDLEGQFKQLRKVYNKAKRWIAREQALLESALKASAGKK